MEVALYLIHDRVFVKNSSIVGTSHFVEVQVTLGCFLLDPQILVSRCLNLPSPRRATMARAALASPSTTPFMCVPTSLYIDMSPSISADALTKPYNSASAEARAKTACVSAPHGILQQCCGVFFCNMPNLSETFHVDTAFLEI